MTDFETLQCITETFDFLKSNYDREIRRAVRTGKPENLHQADCIRHEIMGFSNGLLSAGVDREDIEEIRLWLKSFYN